MARDAQAIPFTAQDLTDPTLSRFNRNNNFIYEQLGAALDKAEAALAASKAISAPVSTGNTTVIVSGGGGGGGTIVYQLEDLT